MNSYRGNTNSDQNEYKKFKKGKNILKVVEINSIKNEIQQLYDTQNKDKKINDGDIIYSQSNNESSKKDDYLNKNWTSNIDNSSNYLNNTSKYKKSSNKIINYSNSSFKNEFPFPIPHQSDKSLKSSYQAFKSSYINLDVNQENQNFLKIKNSIKTDLSDKKEKRKINIFSENYVEDNLKNIISINPEEKMNNKNIKSSTKATTENVSTISDDKNSVSNTVDFHDFMRNKKEIHSDQTLKISKFEDKNNEKNDGNKDNKSLLKSSSPLKKKSKILNLNPEEVENLYLSNNIKPIMTLNLNSIKKPIKSFNEQNNSIIQNFPEVPKTFKIPNKTLNDFKFSLESDTIKPKHKSVTESFFDNLKFEREILCKTIVNPSHKNNNHINNLNNKLFTIEEETRKYNNVQSDNKLNFKTQYSNFNNLSKPRLNKNNVNNDSYIVEEKLRSKNKLISKKSDSIEEDDDDEKEFDITGKYNINMYTNKNSLIVKEYSYFQDINKIFKDKMEDVSKTIEGVYKNFKYGIFSIYDGHGGSEVAIFCKNALINNFKKHFESINSSIIKLNQYDQYDQSKNLEKSIIEEIKTYIKNSYIATDSQCKIRLGNDCGSTATIAFIFKFYIKLPKYKQVKDLDDSSELEYDFENVSKKLLFVSNIGDSTCYLLGKKGECRKVSIDHKCSDVEESRRVRSCGGTIIYNRVMGELMVTRAFGDNKLKLFGVTAEPYIFFSNLSEIDNWLILASDGIWDGVNSYDLISNTKHCTSSEDLSRFLTRLSVTRGSKDNISLICIRL